MPEQAKRLPIAVSVALVSATARAVALVHATSEGRPTDLAGLSRGIATEAARLGEPIRLIVLGEVGAKGFRLRRKLDDEAEVSYACIVRVLSVEAAELA